MGREAASSQAGSPRPGRDTSTVDRRLRGCAISSKFAEQHDRRLQTWLAREATWPAFRSWWCMKPTGRESLDDGRPQGKIAALSLSSRTGLAPALLMHGVSKVQLVFVAAHLEDDLWSHVDRRARPGFQLALL